MLIKKDISSQVSVTFDGENQLIAAKNNNIRIENDRAIITVSTGETLHLKNWFNDAPYLWKIAIIKDSQAKAILNNLNVEISSPVIVVNP